MAATREAAPPAKSRLSAAAGELGALLWLAGPLVLAHAGNQLMNLVDLAVVGRLGAPAVAGVGLGNAVYFAVSIVGVGVMLSLDPLLTQALGAKDEAGAARLLWQGVYLGAAVGAALTLPIALSPLVFEPSGISAAASGEATRYLLARLPGLIPFLLFIGARSALQAKGRSWALVLAMVVGNLVNFALALLLVFGGDGLLEAARGLWFLRPISPLTEALSRSGALSGVPALGVLGAGLATSAATAVQLGISALALRGFAGSPAPIDRAALKEALKLGVPIGLQMASEVGIFTLVGFMAGALGDLELASHQVALTMASFSFTMAMGVSAAGTVRVGRAVGALDREGTRRAGFVALFAGAGLMAGWGLVYWSAPYAIVDLLTTDAAVRAVAAPLFAVAAVFQISDGLQAVGAGVLRGAGDTRYPFLANLAGHYLVGLPVALVAGFALGGGIFGLWWGLCAGLTAVAAALVVRFARLSSRAIAPVAERR